ncbi:MAG: hypothetical protein C4523_18400 [Myxococcales bacterium]|nr:MAG: hypothetical protein C4523_18400 [Myxococcales bacterium]
MMTKRAQIVKDILWTLVFWGVAAGALRLWMGLGETTHLSDAMPWGVWKILNMLGGAALSTSGFMLGVLVYVLRRERFRPLVRPAILIAALGYGSSLFALLFDIGLPHRFWHPVFMWNLHSFLFEVFWCVSLYFMIAALEALPIVLQDRAKRLTHVLHGAVLGLVIVGASLSTLHHSSLGSLFLLTPQRLHALWYSPLLPLMFLLSAFGGGVMFLIAVRIVYAWMFDPEPVFGWVSFAPPRNVCGGKGDESPTPGRELPTLSSLGVIAAVILALYLAVKVFDSLWYGNWRQIDASRWETWLWLLDLTLTAVIPVVLIAVPAGRRSVVGLLTAGACGAAGLVLNRLNVGVFGFFADAGSFYFPSLAEWSLSLGIIAGAALVYLWLAERARIFGDGAARPDGGLKAAFESFAQFWRYTPGVSEFRRHSLIAVVMLPLAFASLSGHSEAVSGFPKIEPPIGLDATRARLRLDGDRQGESTVFNHASHQQRLGGEQSCRVCHHISLPNDKATPCWRCHRQMNEATDLFNHFGHMERVAAKEKLGGLHPANASCVFCHESGGPKLSETAKPCLECHKEDMAIVYPWDFGDYKKPNLHHPHSYREAMHKLCIGCHRAKQNELGKTGMDECGHCHRKD